MQEEDNQDLARDICITKLFDHGEPTRQSLCFCMASPPVLNNSINLGTNTLKKDESERLPFREREMKLPHDIITPGTPGVPLEIQPRLIGAVKDLHAKK